MSLSFYEFTRLPDEQQFNLVFKEREFIDTREIGENRFPITILRFLVKHKKRIYKPFLLQNFYIFIKKFVFVKTTS